MSTTSTATAAMDCLTEGDKHDSAEPVITGMFAALTSTVTLPLRCRRAAEAANDDASTEASPEAERAEPAKRQLARIVGPRLARARTLAGYGQHEAAERLDYATPGQLNQQEMGSRLAPLNVLIKIGRLYGVSVDYLVGESDEPDRDPSSGNRAAILRGVRNALDSTARVVVEAVDRHAHLVGPAAGNVRSLIDSGRRMADAINALPRLNAEQFDDLKGGATAMRSLAEFEAALADATRRLRLHDARDADLRAALAKLHDSDVPLLDDEAEA